MATTATRPAATGTQAWRNWAGDQTCTPAAIERPRSREELAAVVRAAAEAGRSVRVAGSGHSFTEAALTDGVMVRVEALNRVLDANPMSGLVKVEAGIVLADLNERLHELGLAMENLGDIDRQTLAGAISTATHGTGAGLRNISAQVEAMEIVTADGELRALSASGARDDLLAARVGLGALGAIYSVTLRTVPAFTLHRVDTPRPLGEVLGRFDELAERNDHFEFFVFPYTETALTIERNRSELAERPRSALSRWASDVVMENTVRRPGAAADPPPAVADPPFRGPCGEDDVAGRAPRPQLPDLRQRAAHPLHRDGVRAAARSRPGGGPADHGTGREAPDRDGDADRVPGCRP